MNIAITGNPYEGENTTVLSGGVTISAKVAKLNNDTKRPMLVSNWEKGRPSVIPSVLPVNPEPVLPKDYNSFLNGIGIVAVEYPDKVNEVGAKKLRVNGIVNVKASNIYRSVNKEVVASPKQELVDQIKALSLPLEEVKREEVHGRHERTGEVPVDAIKEAIRFDTTSNITPISSRMQRNMELNSEPESVKQKQKAGDMDWYNNLVHSSKDDDVSRQLQGARKELSNEQEESKKLAEQYGKAVRELEKLKDEVESKRQMKIQKEKEELHATLNTIETLKRENYERTSDLSSIQAEIAKLKAEKEEMESSIYESRSMGRAA